MIIIRKYLRILAVLITMVFILSLTGCDNKSTIPSSKPQGSIPAPKSAPPKSSQPAPVSQPAKDKPLNCNWTISVNDEISKKIEMWNLKYSLEFTAVKQGGTDQAGFYKGKAVFKIKGTVDKMPGVDESLIKVMGNVEGEGTDNNLSFTVMNNIELAPLVPIEKDKTTSNKVDDADYVAGGNLNMKGTGALNILVTTPNAQGQANEKADSNTSVYFQMYITGATVKIVIPNAGEFKGTVVGDPIK